MAPKVTSNAAAAKMLAPNALFVEPKTCASKEEVVEQNKAFLDALPEMLRADMEGVLVEQFEKFQRSNSVASINAQADTFNNLRDLMKLALETPTNVTLIDPKLLSAL